MTFLFCDVRGFTTISESFKNDPQALTRLINRFLTPMTDRILASLKVLHHLDSLMLYSLPLSPRHSNLFSNQRHGSTPHINTYKSIGQTFKKFQK